MIFFRQTSILLGILCLLSAVTWAQQNTGSMSGTVTDQSAGTVPGATVVATQLQTGLKTTTVSTDAGVYVFASLPVGVYEVSVEKAGFKKLNRKNIEVRVAQRLTLDLSLEVGSVQESVEVTAQGPLLDTETSERGQNFSNQLMNTLPLFTGGIRNASSFVTYMPGVNSYREVSISGSGGRGKEVMIDGASLTIPESGGVVFNFPGTEMFQEFKLVTAPTQPSMAVLAVALRPMCRNRVETIFTEPPSGMRAATSSTRTAGRTTPLDAPGRRSASTRRVLPLAARPGFPRFIMDATRPSGLSPTRVICVRRPSRPSPRPSRRRG